MTEQAGLMLVETIRPLIAGAVARGAVKPVGAEDHEELTAEGCSMAAAALESLEQRGKTVGPRSIAYYALVALKGGRRSYGSGRTDVMGVATALSGRAHVTSMDAPACDSDDQSDDATLHEMLASSGESPDVAASRNLDWDDLASDLDARKSRIIRETTVGTPGKDIAAELKVSPARLVQLKREIAQHVRDHWGDDCLVETQRPPAWWWHQRVAQESRACRYSRAVA